MLTNRDKQVISGQVIIDQADFLQPDEFNRVAGLVPAALQSWLFFNNVLQAWPLVDGSTFTDIQIAAGKIYWHEVPGSLGYYSVRFRPDALGSWRLLISYPAGTQQVGQNYDVIPAQPSVQSGLRPAFSK